MNIHEYQAKDLLKEFGAPVPKGVVIYDIKEVAQKTKTLGTNNLVVKAQIHAGGRGKGGGVKFCPSTESAIDSANKILGMSLITHQTGLEGKLVNQILITEALNIESSDLKTKYQEKLKKANESSVVEDIKSEMENLNSVWSSKASLMYDSSNANTEPKDSAKESVSNSETKDDKKIKDADFEVVED